MTSVKVNKKNNHIISVSISGHAGAGAYGQDIVCAAISALSQTAALGLIKVAKIDAHFHRDELKGSFRITLPEELSEAARRDADMILETMMCGIRDIETGYPKYIKTEVTACL